MTEVFPGQILGGKFRVDRVLGAGGMGMVVSATHLQLDERVAIKFLLPEALANPEAVARFGREAKAAVKIRGEHVARVIDVGTFDNGAPFMVMEHLEGHDLSTLIHNWGAMAPAEAVDAILQACEALAEAHNLGIVHRDLKPANLFMTLRPDGTSCVKVLDFGISKVAAAGDHSVTKTSAIMGSPLYMSPEQMTSSRNVDARSDIWALGIVLYELLTGRVPFSADTLPEICGLILTAEPAPVRNFAPGVPEGLQAAVLHCLQKDRDRRFFNVSQVAMALAPYGSRATSRSVERIARILGARQAQDYGPMSEPTLMRGGAAFGQPTQSAFGKTTSARSGAAGLVFAVGFLVLVVGGLVIFLILRPKSSIEPVAAASTQPALVQALPAQPIQPAHPAVAPPAEVVPVVSAAAATPKPSAVAAAPVAVVPAHPAALKVVPKAVVVAPPTPVVAPPAPPAPAPVKAKRSVEDLLSGRN